MPAPLTGIGLEGHDHRLGSTSSCMLRYFLQRRTGRLRNHAGISVFGRMAVQGLMRYVRTSAAWSPVMRDWPYAMPWERESSPLARGLLYRGVVELRPRRIIPARAGFTPPVRVSSRPRTDHPRTRGVYRCFVPFRILSPGSSPHTRGLLAYAAERFAKKRIIPAHAGFTSPDTDQSQSSPDHPRTRGVYTISAQRRPGTVGSSPHTRGLPVV